MASATHSQQVQAQASGPHLDLFFGVVHVGRFLLEFSRDHLELLGDVVDPGAEVLFYFSGFLNLSLFRKNLEIFFSTNAT